MPRAIRGVLVECDAAIKTIIVKIDSEKHNFIVEELDDEHLVIQESMLKTLQMRLEEVLEKTQEPDYSGSE